jgi:hypothetical protein
MPFGVPAMPFLQGPKVEQRHDLNGAGTGWVFFRDSFVVPGDGVLSVRLKGDVVGRTRARRRVHRLDGDLRRVGSRVASMTLPLLGDGLVRYVRIVVTPLGGRSVLDLRSIEAVTSLDLVNATALEIPESTSKDPSILADVRFPKAPETSEWMWLRLGFGAKYGAVRLVGLRRGTCRLRGRSNSCASATTAKSCCPDAGALPAIESSPSGTGKSRKSTAFSSAPRAGPVAARALRWSIRLRVGRSSPGDVTFPPVSLGRIDVCVPSPSRPSPSRSY